MTQHWLRKLPGISEYGIELAEHVKQAAKEKEWAEQELKYPRKSLSRKQTFLSFTSHARANTLGSIGVKKKFRPSSSTRCERGT